MSAFAFWFSLGVSLLAAVVTILALKNIMALIDRDEIDDDHDDSSTRPL